MALSKPFRHSKGIAWVRLRNMRLNVIAVDDNLVHEFGLLSDAESSRDVDSYFWVGRDSRED